MATVWAAVLGLRHLAYRVGLLTSRRGAIPTLVVGNLEVGGTGKTPTVVDVARRLSLRLGPGAVGVLSRGYGRRSKGVRWVAEAQTWEDVGDEPWMMQRALPEVAVAVGADRLQALDRMHADRPALRVVVLDDGFQHRALKPDRSLLLLSRPLPAVGAWSVLPAGPWRDLPSARRRADVLVCSPSLPHEARPAGAWVQRAATPRLTSLTGHATDAPALVVTGIAQPGRLNSALAACAPALAGWACYPDHHAFTPRDLAAWNAWGTAHGVTHLVTTAKDHVRLEPWLDHLSGWTVSILEHAVVWEQPDRVDAWLETWLQTLPS